MKRPKYTRVEFMREVAVLCKKYRVLIDADANRVRVTNPPDEAFTDDHIDLSELRKYVWIDDISAGHEGACGYWFDKKHTVLAP